MSLSVLSRFVVVNVFDFHSTFVGGGQDSAVAYRGGLEGSNPPQNSEVLTELNRIAN